MNKKQFINMLYKYLKVIGFINLDIAINERDRLNINKNVFKIKNSKNLSELQVFKIKLSKEAKEDDTFIRKHGEYIVLPQYLDLIKNEITCNYINRYLQVLIELINENNINIDNINVDTEELSDILILKFKNEEVENRVLPMYLNNYITINEYINSNKISGINYIILDEKNLSQYKTIMFEIGIKYRYILIINNSIKIFRTWKEIDEYQNKE